MTAPRNWIAWFALLLLTVFGGWLRMVHLTTQPTWWDEHVSLIAASGQIARQGDAFAGRVNSATSDFPISSPAVDGNRLEIVKVVGSRRASNVSAATLFWDRGNGLAFNLILHYWTRAFGCSDRGMRALPWLFGTLAIPVVFLVAMRAGADSAGSLAAAALVASNALLVDFSREARPYTMAVFMALVATACLFSIEKGGKFRVLVPCYIVSLIALTFSHYFALPVVLGAHCAGVIFSRKKLALSAVLGAGLIVTSLALGLWMAWGGHLGMAAMREHDQVWLQRAHSGIIWWLQPFHWPDALRIAVERPVHMNWPHLLFWPREHPLAGALATIFGGLAAFGFWRWWHADKSARALPAVVILALSAGSLFSLALSWKSGHTLPFLNRYLIFYVPFQSVAFGLAITGCLPCAHGFRTWAAACAVLILAGGGLAMMAANIRVDFQPKEKALFSFDAAVAQAKPGAIVRCASLDSALVFALKAGPHLKSVRIEMDPDVPKIIDIQNP
jgi:uncharacterized membrane protein